MKKVLALLCCIMLFISFIGCSKQTESTEQTADASAAVPTETTNKPTAPAETTAQNLETNIITQPIVSVALPMQSETFTDENGNVLLNYSAPYIVLSMSEQEIADRITLEFLNRIDETANKRVEIIDSAKSAVKTEGNWRPYQYTVVYEPKRVDNGVVSLLGCEASYLGAHIDKIYNSVNYNMTTGHNLSLLNIIADDTKINDLCQLVINTLSDKKEQLSLYEDFESTVKDHFDSGINDAWFFSASGLCFFFSPYDIAPYSSGVVVAEIPYANLLGIIKDDYFPEEQANTPGLISAKNHKKDLQNDFTRFTELSINEGGSEFLLYTDDSVNDIQIIVGNKFGNSLTTEQYTVFAQSSLTKGDAILVSADFTLNQSIKIKYRSGEQTIESNIVWDESTGKISINDLQ